MTKKLRLQVEELHVEQFPVEADAAAYRGTVRGLGDPAVLERTRRSSGCCSRCRTPWAEEAL
jgi:hypothetical protein